MRDASSCVIRCVDARFPWPGVLRLRFRRRHADGKCDERYHAYPRHDWSVSFECTSVDDNVRPDDQVVTRWSGRHMTSCKLVPSTKEI